MQTVIMAGGKGTRIASVNAEVPKPMLEVCGKPILEHQIEVLKRQNLTDIILVIGYLGSVIRDYFQDGSKYGVHISYIEEKELLGTAGSFYYLKDIIQDDFFLLNGDLIFDVDLHRFMNFHKEKHALATLFTHPNNHPYDSGLIIANEDGTITKWIHKEEERGFLRNRVNAGIHIISPMVLQRFTELKKTDLDREVLKPLIPSGRVYAYDSPEYVKDMGTPERYRQVEQDLLKGRVRARNLDRKQKCIFLDRDGTLNVYKGFLTDIEELELIPGTAEALKCINSSEYLAIVITNQPVIARGGCSVQELEEIHNKLETLLGKEGAYIDALYYCPHHPDKGFEGERPEYKIECDCRKPKPGMLLKAAEDYNIDLYQSIMIGDGKNDMEAGKAAGCQTILVDEQNTLLSVVKDLREKGLL
ncbi:HAD-IIIA family hydrolase [Roseburia inulinivorans]